MVFTAQRNDTRSRQGMLGPPNLGNDSLSSRAEGLTMVFNGGFCHLLKVSHNNKKVILVHWISVIKAAEITVIRFQSLLILHITSQSESCRLLIYNLTFCQ